MPKKKIKLPKDLLRRASRPAIAEIVGTRVRRAITRRRWLATSNRYRDDTIERLRRDTDPPPPSRLNGQHLADYVAASAPIHAIDGWSFLGRSVGAFLRGDRSTCIHLAYYAELRAAMSLLAAEAIGVFSFKHCIVDGTQNAISFSVGGGTHTSIWPLFDDWAKTRRSMDLLDQTFQPNGISITQWLQFAQLADSSHQIARVWFKSWGIDLKQLSDDHEARNLASYRPSQFTPVDGIDAKTMARFVTELWKGFEPDGTGIFRTLDYELLRLALEKSFLGKTGKTVLEDSSTFADYIDRALKSAPIDKEQQDPIRHYLTRKTVAQDSLIVSEALRSSDFNESRFPLQVLSRAVLLLRFATGASRNLLRHANISSHDLRFWLERYGSEHILWDPTTPPNNPLELWSDIEESLKETAYLTSKTPPEFTVYSWTAALPQNLLTLSNCELIGLWALAT